MRCHCTTVKHDWQVVTTLQIEVTDLTFSQSNWHKVGSVNGRSANRRLHIWGIKRRLDLDDGRYNNAVSLVWRNTMHFGCVNTLNSAKLLYVNLCNHVMNISMWVNLHFTASANNWDISGGTNGKTCYESNGAERQLSGDLSDRRQVEMSVVRHYNTTEQDRHYTYAQNTYSVSQKIPLLQFSDIFPKRLGIFNKFLYTYYAFLSTLDYKFLFSYLQLWQSYAILSDTTHRTKLSLLTEQMTSLLTSCHIQHVCWHYKSSRSGMTCHRKRSTKLSATFANVWMCAFRRMVAFWAYYVN